MSKGKLLIRECTDQDLESIYQLDRLWEEENVAYIFTYQERDGFLLAWFHSIVKKAALSAFSSR